MPNYGLIINSHFKPFSYQEMLAPTLQQTEAHQALNEAYSALGTQAGTVEAMLNRELDKEAYNQYKRYMEGLQEQADILAKEGLNPSLRNSLLNMKTRYGQEIIPIQQAAERRNQLAEEQRKLGNSMIFDFDASTTNISKFMNNPSLNYQSIDRIGLLKESQEQFSQFQNELREFKIDPSRRLDKFHNTLIESYGFSPEQATEYAKQVASGRMDESTAIGIVANNLYKSTGVSKWNNEDASDKVWQTIAEGLQATVGKTNATAINDEQALLNAKAASELNIYKEKLRIAKEQEDQEDQANLASSLRAWDPNIAYLYQGSNSSGKSGTSWNMIPNNVYQSFIAEGLIDNDGNVTSLGRAVLNGSYSNSYLRGNTSSTDNTSGSSESEGSLHLPNDEELLELSRENTMNSFKEYYSNEGRNNNVVGTAVSRLNIIGEDRDNIERAIKGAIGTNGRIYSIGSLDTDAHTITEGSSISASDFDKLIKDGTRVKYIGNNSYTNQIFFQMDNGNWYHMPSSVYSSNALSIISQNNMLLQKEGITPTEEALYGNNIMTQLGQPLNNDTGTSMEKNNGTITFPIE